jgi:hypothetical protein
MSLAGPCQMLLLPRKLSSSAVTPARRVSATSQIQALTVGTTGSMYSASGRQWPIRSSATVDTDEGEEGLAMNAQVSVLKCVEVYGIIVHISKTRDPGKWGSRRAGVECVAQGAREEMPNRVASTRAHKLWYLFSLLEAAI